MQKSLQILFGLTLILVLAYVAFLDVSSKIKDDLLLKTQTMFSNNNVKGVSANIQGEGLEMSRSLVLTGTAISDIERVRIVTLIENIKGVCRIDNQITLYPVVLESPIVPLVPKVPIAIKAPLVNTDTGVIMPKMAQVEGESVESTNATNIPLVNTPIESVLGEKKEPSILVPTPISISKVPLVPVVENKADISPLPSVPTPVKAISTVKVIEIEKIKLEGVK